MGEEHRYNLSADLWLAAKLGQQKPGAGCSTLLVHVHEVRRRNLGPNDPETLEVERHLEEIDNAGT
jgi:hypothetical protein